MPGSTSASRIEQLLEQARRPLRRVAPADLESEVAAGAVVVDIRPEVNRREEGVLPGALVVERIHLEWRLDPTSPDRLPEAHDPHRRVVLVCNEGYSSSLAALSLQQLGLVNATDLVDGYRGWQAMQSPSAPPAGPAG